MIGYIYEKLIGKRNQKKPTRAEVLASRPVRNPAVQWDTAAHEEDEPTLTLLKVPRRRDKLGNFAARFFRLPDYKKIELDEIGSDVWEKCDGEKTVESITREICAKYKLNRRQAETSVTAYLRMLAERRLIAVRAGGGGGSRGSSSKATAATGEVLSQQPPTRRRKRA